MWCTTILLGGLFLGAPPIEDVNRAVRAVLEDRSIQSSFPGENAPRPGPVSTRPPPDPTPAPSPPTASPFATVLMWTLIAVGVALLGLWLVRSLGGYQREVSIVVTPDEATSPRAPPAGALPDARALAEAGRYEEAIHGLLLVALEALDRRTALPGSLTGREIVREAAVPDGARDAVGHLVGAVEISLFGGRPLGREEYEACVGHYEAFTAALGRAA